MYPNQGQGAGKSIGSAQLAQQIQGGAPPSPPDSPLSRELMRLIGTTASLESAIESLGSRLSPVLVPINASPATGTPGTSATPPSLGAVVDVLSATSDRLEGILERLAALHNGLVV